MSADVCNNDLAGCIADKEELVNWAAKLRDLVIEDITDPVSRDAMMACPIEVLANVEKWIQHKKTIVADALHIMKQLHEAAAPDDSPDLNAVIPAAKFREFVDAHAQLLYRTVHPDEPEERQA